MAASPGSRLISTNKITLTNSNSGMMDKTFFKIIYAIESTLPKRTSAKKLFIGTGRLTVVKRPVPKNQDYYSASHMVASFQWPRE